MDSKTYFTDNLSSHQRQYEAIRAIAFSEGTYKDVAYKFGMSKKYLENLVYKLKKGKYTLFPEVKKGPRTRRINDDIKNKIISCRRKKMPTSEVPPLNIKKNALNPL